MNPKLAGALKSKTIWFALALGVLGVVQANLEVFNAYLTPAAAGWASLCVGVAVAVLRAATTLPLDEK